MKTSFRCAVALVALAGLASTARADEEAAASPLKNIRLNSTGTVTLSLGGELRERYEYYEAPAFGLRGIERDDYLLHRLLVNADLRLGEHVRVFLELGNHLQTGKAAVGPTDVDEFDVQQAFIDLIFPIRADTKLTARAGRQQMTFGSGRLVSIRDGPNIRRSFDGARLMLHTGEVAVDAFLVQTVRLQVGSFNDKPENDETFWGLYGVLPLPRLPDGHIDLYYLGLERKDAAFVQGNGDEHRHSLGARLWGKPGAWDYNFEGVVQVGTFGDADIFAWTIATETGYTFASVPFTPRISLDADIASGDANPHDRRLGTFNALFPKQSYFSEASILAPANLMDLHPAVALHLTDKLSLTNDVDFFWKHELDDAIYTTPGRPLVRPGRTGARFTGSQYNAQLQWELTKQLSVTLYYSHFFAGPAVTGAGGRDVDFAGSWIKYEF